MKVGISGEDGFSQSKWIAGVNQVAARLRRIQPPSLVGDTTGNKTGFFPSHKAVKPDKRHQLSSVKVMDHNS